MSAEVLVITVLDIIAIILCLILISSVIYEFGRKNQRGKRNDDGDWLFANLSETVYVICFKKEPEGKMFGFDTEKYERYCRLLNLPIKTKSMVGMCCEGILLMFTMTVLSYLSIGQNLYLALLLLMIGIVAFLFLAIIPFNRIKGMAEERLYRISDDLPRFLSLMEKALDHPIGQAIIITASKFSSPLSDDLLQGIAEVSLGAGGWQESLLRLAQVYNNEAFNDVVLEIINAFSQGADIRPLIIRKTHELEQIRLYDIEAHDAKVKSLIYIPIIALKLFPIMAIICIPMLTNFNL